MNRKEGRIRNFLTCRGRRPDGPAAIPGFQQTMGEFAAAISFPQRGIGVKLTITGDFKQSKQQKQAKSKDVFALKKHKTNEAFQVK
ncbi:MAG: hypothetical protein IKM84_03785, partial [Oscillospiraceae bacterium]|nr:hypothetical protein [Oscillospiraceae bacterium]